MKNITKNALHYEMRIFSTFLPHSLNSMNLLFLYVMSAELQ